LKINNLIGSALPWKRVLSIVFRGEKAKGRSRHGENGRKDTAFLNVRYPATHIPGSF